MKSCVMHRFVCTVAGTAEVLDHKVLNYVPTSRLRAIFHAHVLNFYFVYSPYIWLGEQAVSEIGVVNRGRGSFSLPHWFPCKV